MSFRSIKVPETVYQALLQQVGERIRLEERRVTIGETLEDLLARKCPEPNSPEGTD